MAFWGIQSQSPTATVKPLENVKGVKTLRRQVTNSMLVQFKDSWVPPSLASILLYRVDSMRKLSNSGRLSIEIGCVSSSCLKGSTYSGKMQRSSKAKVAAYNRVSYLPAWRGGGLYYGRLVDGAKPYSDYLAHHALDGPRVWSRRGVNKPLHAINLNEVSLAHALNNGLFTGLFLWFSPLRYSRRFLTIGARVFNSVLKALCWWVAKLATYLQRYEYPYFRHAYLTYGARHAGAIRTSSAAMMTSNGNWSAASTNSWFCTGKNQCPTTWMTVTPRELLAKKNNNWPLQ